MAEEKKNEVQVSFSEGLTNRLESIAPALPSNLNKERFVQELMYTLNNNPDLQKCSKASIFEGSVQAALMNLSFQQREAYLIPRAGKAVFQSDYKGEIKFTKAYSERPIRDIYAQVVHENDKFSRKIVNGETTFEYEENFGNPGKIVGCFATVIFQDGVCLLEYMTVDEVNNVRNSFSKQANGTAWKSGYTEMMKKTVLRRLCKHIPKVFCSVEQGQAWEDSSDFEFKNERPRSNPSEVVDAFDDAPDESVVAEVVAEEVNE